MVNRLSLLFWLCSHDFTVPDATKAKDLFRQRTRTRALRRVWLAVNFGYPAQMHRMPDRTWARIRSSVALLRLGYIAPEHEPDRSSANPSKATKEVSWLLPPGSRYYLLPTYE